MAQFWNVFKGDNVCQLILQVAGKSEEALSPQFDREIRKNLGFPFPNSKPETFLHSSLW